MPRPAYPYDRTDAEWVLIDPLAPAPLPGGRPLRHPRREIVNAIVHVPRTGRQWRAVPHDLPLGHRLAALPEVAGGGDAGAGPLGAGWWNGPSPGSDATAA